MALLREDIAPQTHISAKTRTTNHEPRRVIFAHRRDPRKATFDVTTAGKMGEFRLLAVLGYIGAWVAHFPDTLQDIDAPIPTPN